MKVLIITIACFFCFEKASAQIPTIVNDPLTLGEVIALGTTAVGQLTTLGQVLKVAEDGVKRIKQVTKTISVISDIQSVISLGTRSYNTGASIINYVSTSKVIDPQTALQYTGVCINGTNNIIRNIDRLTEIMTDSFEANPAERAAMIAKVKQEIEMEEKMLNEVDAAIKREMALQSLQMIVAKSQGLR